MTALRVAGTGLLPHVEAPQAGRSDSAPAPVERRTVYLENGCAEIDVFDGADLRPGHRIAGPALIAEHTTTALIGTDDWLEVDAANNFMIHLGGSDD